MCDFIIVHITIISFGFRKVGFMLNDLKRIAELIKIWMILLNILKTKDFIIF